MYASNTNKVERMTKKANYKALNGSQSGETKSARQSCKKAVKQLRDSQRHNKLAARNMV